MLQSIRWRIAAAYIVLIVVTLLGFSIYLLDLFDHQTVENLRTSLTSQAKTIEYIVSTEFDKGTSPSEFDGIAKQLGEETGLRVTIVAADGLVLGDSLNDPSTMENHLDRPEIADARQTGMGYSVRTGSTMGQRQMYVAVPVNSGGQTVGYARVSLAITTVEASEDGIRHGAIFAGLFASALAIGLAVVIARQVTKPVNQLTRLARELSRGNFDGKIAESSGGEIGQLAGAFNQMSCRLQESLRTLSQEKTRLEAILANMADGIVITDRNGTVELGNRAASQILRWPLDRMAGRSFVEIARDHELAEALKTCLETGAPQNGLVELGPRHRIIRALMTRVVDPDVVAGLVVLQDITVMRRTEATRRDFVANVSHELRTPLASIKVLVETLQAGALDDREAAEHFLEKMNVEVDNLTQLVRELLELSRIESGQSPVKTEETDVLPLVQRAIDRLLAQAERAGIEMDIDVADDLPPVMADPDRIGQVLGNLIHNAIKFTPAKGLITVSARLTDDGTVAIAVKDTGVGIAREDLPRIFERFYKADKARSGGGTGLGLAIAKHIVRAHGGAIEADSTEGKGSTFTFTLPVVNKNLTGANTTLTL